MVDVHCYSNCSEVSLLLNDTLVGTKSSAEAREGVLTWRIPFQAGTLKAVGRNDGRVQSTGL